VLVGEFGLKLKSDKKRPDPFGWLLWLVFFGLLCAIGLRVFWDLKSDKKRPDPFGLPLAVPVSGRK